MNDIFQRLGLIIGSEALEKMAQTRVLVFGLGGVGSWCAEALVRSGMGKIGLIDYDTIAESNINRQIQATSRTVGQPKAQVLAERLREINPHCEVSAWNTMFSLDDARDSEHTDKNINANSGAAQFDFKSANYVIDAIDTLTHKLDLIETSCAAGVTLFSSMGMALRMDPTRIKTAGIWETQGCPLAKLVRDGLRKRNFGGSFICVYSDESKQQYGQGDKPQTEESGAGRKIINGSAVTVTASAGMILASLVLRDICRNTGTGEALVGGQP